MLPGATAESFKVIKRNAEASTHRLEGELGLLQVVLALDLQQLGPLVDHGQVGGTAESVRGVGVGSGGGGVGGQVSPFKTVGEMLKTDIRSQRTGLEGSKLRLWSWRPAGWSLLLVLGRCDASPLPRFVLRRQQKLNPRNL